MNKVNLGQKPARSKILLMLLPFWPPQIPPMGISCLKSFLQPRGFDVTILDMNIDDEFRGKIYNRYFDTIKRYVPEEKRGNLYGIGTDVLKNQLMAHINYQNERDYRELLKIIIFRTYFVDFDETGVSELVDIVSEYYTHLEGYICGLLEKHRPSVLGISVTSGTLPSSLFAFRLAKQRFPGIGTVMGGGVFSDHLAQGSPNFDYFLEKTRDCIDHFIIGEGELLFFKLVTGELPLSQRVFTLKDLGGELLDLSTADIPDFSGLQIQRYPYSSAYTSRSCPFQCAFCSETVLWGKYRKKPADRAVRDFERLYERDGTQLFSMSDSLINPVISGISKEFIKSPYALYWDACLRACDQAGDIENTHRWRQGGFYKAWLGIESGSQRVLDLMDKRITLDQARKTITGLAHAGIKTATLWLIGFPGESEEDFQQTLDLIEELKDDIYDAEGTPFWYFLKGQSNSGSWKEKRPLLLYPEQAKEMLITQTWVLSGKPSREITYQRLNRFIRHINQLGIPNPYNLREMYEADERWKKLHKNAVPSIVEFKGPGYIDECKHIKKILPITDVSEDEGDFGF
ncbi:MAG: radical SAM protein [Candidatus Aminicenantes bacterium]|jgi:radical SAM superfamily enzyme YgiQ (UPF0313 family)